MISLILLNKKKISAIFLQKAKSHMTLAVRDRVKEFQRASGLDIYLQFSSLRFQRLVAAFANSLVTVLAYLRKYTRLPRC
jgi:hypothetical protein